MFFDESHANTKDFRRKYGLSLIGFPAFMRIFNAAHGQGPGFCGLVAMSLRGPISVSVVNHIVDHVLLMNVLEREVLPLMNRYPLPESVLVMDNAATHDHDAVHALCERFGVICVFLPPYSYDFNQIEPSFHQSKEYMRARYPLAAQQHLAAHLFEAFTSITKFDSISYYRHCGYVVDANDIAWIDSP